MAPGQAERQTHDYVRHGTTSLFATLDVATGEVIGRCYRRHRAKEFLRSPDEIHARVPHEPGVEVHQVPDIYATHKTPAVKRWFLRHPEYRLRFTPTSSPWLNQVERFFARITERRVRRGVFRSVAALEAAIRKYLEHHNAFPKPFVWTADADLILGSIRRVREPTSDSGHRVGRVAPARHAGGQRLESCTAHLRPSYRQSVRDGARLSQTGPFRSIGSWLRESERPA